MGKRKYVIRMFVFLLVLTVGIIGTIYMQTKAKGAEAVKSDIGAFDDLVGNYRYIQNQYYDCYTLDMEETGLLETGYAMLNDIANTLFTFIKWLAKSTTALFYFCMDFDVAELFKDLLNDIQNALHESIFQPLFVLGFCCTGIILLKKFLKRDLMGAYGQLARVLLLVILSILIVQDSSEVLSAATGLTKSISTQALTGINGGESTGSFAAQSAGVLWVSLIHQPWLTIEFGSDNIEEGQANNFLNPANAPGSDNRKSLVKNYSGTAFSMKRAGEKIGFMFLYLFPFLLKCLIYIAISVIQLLFQFMAVFWTVLAPIVLIITMIPGYEGMLGSWVRKFLESQFSILIITFMMGLLIKFDELLYGWANEWGWLVVMIIQVCVSIGVVAKRDSIMGALSKMQKGVSMPSYAMAAMRRSGDGFALASGAAQNIRRQSQKMGTSLSKTARLAGGLAKSGAESVQGSVHMNGEAKRLEAGLSMHIDAETGEWISRPVFEAKQEAKQQRADEKWQKQVDTYGVKLSNKKRNSNTRNASPIKEVDRSEASITVHRPRMDNAAPIQEKSNVVPFLASAERSEKRQAANAPLEDAGLGTRSINKTTDSIVKPSVPVNRPSMANMDKASKAADKGQKRVNKESISSKSSKSESSQEAVPRPDSVKRKESAGRVPTKSEKSATGHNEDSIKREDVHPAFVKEKKVKATAKTVAASTASVNEKTPVSHLADSSAKKGKEMQNDKILDKKRARPDSSVQKQGKRDGEKESKG